MLPRRLPSQYYKPPSAPQEIEWPIVDYTSDSDARETVALITQLVVKFGFDPTLRCMAYIFYDLYEIDNIILSKEDYLETNQQRFWSRVARCLYTRIGDLAIMHPWPQLWLKIGNLISDWFDPSHSDSVRETIECLDEELWESYPEIERLTYSSFSWLTAVAIHDLVRAILMQQGMVEVITQGQTKILPEEQLARSILRLGEIHYRKTGIHPIEYLTEWWNGCVSRMAVAEYDPTLVEF